MAEVQSLTCQNEKLKAELHGHRGARFGSKSERLGQLTFDLAEDVEIEVAAEAQKNEPTRADSKPPKRPHSRKPLPDYLERQDEVLSAGEECGDCGGSLRQIGEDVTEELEYNPGRAFWPTCWLANIVIIYRLTGNPKSSPARRLIYIAPR